MHTDEQYLGNKSIKVQYTARMIAGLIGILNLVFIFGILMSLMDKPKALVYEIPTSLEVLLCLPIMGTILTLTLPAMTFISWKKRFWSIVTRLHYSLVMVVALGFISFLHYWNLLGFRF